MIECMTPRFKAALQAGFWFVIGFVTCVILHRFHHVAGQ
jgi:hypothetical protein